MKTILISGGSDGLGRACAEKFSKKYKVIILSRDEKKTARAAKEIGCDYVVADVSDYSAVERAVAEVIKKHKKIDYLINNAGFFVAPSEMEGYGHYINEGRKNGAIVITLDAPPMNELVEDGVTGFLVPFAHKEVYNEHSLSERFYVTPEAIQEAVIKAMSLSEEEKQKMGELARKRYEADTAFLQGTIATIARSLQSVGNLSAAHSILQ